jgi:hypothetical protein
VFCEESDNAIPTWFSLIIIVILNQLNIKKIKSTKIILKKIIIKKQKKKQCGGTLQQSQCFKEKQITKLNSHPAQY